MDYSGINAKIKAMYGRLMTQEDFEALSKLKSVEECALKLREYPAYVVAMADIPVKDFRRGTIEQKLLLSNAYDFHRIYGFINSFRLKNFLDVFFMKNEIYILKILLCMVYDERDIDYNLPELESIFSKKLNIDLLKLKTSVSVPGFIENLNGTEFYDLLTTVYSEKHSLFELETQLDLYYYTRLWKSVADLDRVNNKIMKRLIGTEIDLINIIWIYRLKNYYRLAEKLMYGYIIPYRYKLSISNITRMVEAKSIDDLFTEIANGPYGNVFSPKMKPEKSYFMYMNKVLRNIRITSNNSLGLAVSYIYYKQREITNITSLLECVRYELPSTEILSYLTLPHEIEVV